MTTLLRPFETMLEPLFKDLPALPQKGKDWLVRAWPMLALVFGILQILAALSLWHLGHHTDAYIDYANRLSRIYGTGEVVVRHLGLFYWLALLSLVVDGVILLGAYGGLKARRKAGGWDLLFLGATLNLIYGLFSAFDSYYGGGGKFMGTLIGSAIGFYLLFQIRGAYSDTSLPHRSRPAQK